MHGVRARTALLLSAGALALAAAVHAKAPAPESGSQPRRKQEERRCPGFVDRGLCFAQTPPCRADSDCPRPPYYGCMEEAGHCQAWWTCDCISDADCPKNTQCMTNQTVCGLCMQRPRRCRTDTDCLRSERCTEMPSGEAEHSDEVEAPADARPSPERWCEGSTPMTTPRGQTYEYFHERGFR